MSEQQPNPTFEWDCAKARNLSILTQHVDPLDFRLCRYETLQVVPLSGL